MCFVTAAGLSAAVAAGTGLAGAGVAGMAGQNNANAAIQSGIANYDAATYQAQVAANNAVVASQNADYAVAAGQAKAGDVSLKGAENLAKIKSAQATSGVNVNTGSAARVQTSAREVNELSTERTLSDAELTAYGYRTQATNFQAEQGLENLKGAGALQGAGYAATGAELGADATILSDISGVASKWTTGVGTGSFGTTG
jgi:hypothetical protein